MKITVTLSATQILYLIRQSEKTIDNAKEYNRKAKERLDSGNFPYFTKESHDRMKGTQDRLITLNENILKSLKK